MSKDRIQKTLSPTGALHKKRRAVAAPEHGPVNHNPVFSESSPIYRKSSCACGGGCPSCSTGLKVSSPNDTAEIEADRVADRVMRMPSDRIFPVNDIAPAKKTIHRKCNTCEDEEPRIQRKPLPSSGAPAPSQSPGHVREALNSAGRPLDRETRGFFEPRMGYDLGAVRVYTGDAAERSARAVDAKAYTLGSDIVFGSDQFAPGTTEGRRLLAHELAHTLQQNTYGIMHRERRGAAAGCGICMNDPGGMKAGAIAHTEVQLAMGAHNPDIIGEFPIPVVDDDETAPFVPKVDLLRIQETKSQRIVHIGEIKPLDDANEQADVARTKLKDYARELKANASLKIDEVFRMTDPPPPEKLHFFNPEKPATCPDQEIKVQRTEPGIYQYYCEPPWSQLVADSRCKCKKKPEEDKKPEAVPVAKPQTDTDTKDVKDPVADPNAQPQQPPKSVDTDLPEWVLPAAVAGAGLSAATIAYLRKRALEAAEKRALAAAQAAWRARAEAAAAKRAAAGLGKGAAGKTVAKAAIYVEIAAAVALVVLYPENVEASVGPGASSIETLYKAMSSNGTPPSPEMKALIESDPILKQMAEDAGGGGDMSKLQQEMAVRTLQLIKDNPGVFSPEDLDFLNEYSKTAKGKGGGTAPATADELRKAIDAAKAGKTGDGQGKGSGGSGSGSGGGKTDTPKPADDTPTPADPATAGKGDTPGKGDTAAGQPGVLPTPATPADTPAAKPAIDSAALNDENKAKVTGATPAVTDVLREYITKQKKDKKIDDDFIKRFFETVPADLTPDQAAALISRMTDAPADATREAMMESLKKGIEEVRKDPAQKPGGGTTGTPAPGAADKPAKTQEEIIAGLQESAKKYKNFGGINAGSFNIPKGVQKIEGHTLRAYLYGKTKGGVGYVGYITAKIPDDVDVENLKKGQTFTVEITERSPFVDAKGTVHDIKLGSKLTVTK